MTAKKRSKPRNSPSPSPRPRSSRPATVQDLKDNNPTIIQQISEKLGPYQKGALAFTAIVGAIIVAGQVWTYLGGQWLVSDRTLDRTINQVQEKIETKIVGVKTDVNRNIDDTKSLLIKQLDDNKKEYGAVLNEVTKTLGMISRKQDLSALEQAELQMQQAFSQKQNFQNQLNAIKANLVKLKAENRSDEVLENRATQLEDFIKMMDKQVDEARAKQQRLRESAVGGIPRN